MANVFNRQAYKVGTITGSCSGMAVGVTKTGTTVAMNDVEDGTLSAYISVVVGTDTLTWTPGWKVSQDDSTFLTLKNETNTAVTATSGATGTTTLVLSAPAGVYGWPFARAELLSGGTAAATGTGDTWDIRYTYRYRTEKW